MRTSALSERCVRNSSWACSAFGEPSATQACERPLKFGRAGRRVVEATPRPNDKQFGSGAPMGHPVLSAENLQGLSGRQRRGGVAAQEFEVEFGLERMGLRRSMAEFSRAAARRLDQFARAFDLAELPASLRRARTSQSSGCPR